MRTTSGPHRSPRRRMAWVPGGTFTMGSEEFYPEEAPARRVSVDGFWMDEHPVTVAEFGRFVRASGYLTLAEREHGARSELLTAGSLVFGQPAGSADLRSSRDCWSWVPGADWQHPDGPDSTTAGRDGHPVTHVAYADAAAYAAWAGKDLPTEAEWERAARGGLDGATYPWGDEFAPLGLRMANTRFSLGSLAGDRSGRTSAVGSFPPNGYGLYDVAGNVWEWTADFFAPRSGAHGDRSLCVPPEAGRRMPWKVIKGGSYLCAPGQCARYRPAARQAGSIDTSTSHIGFRCVIRLPADPAPG